MKRIMQHITSILGGGLLLLSGACLESERPKTPNIKAPNIPGSTPEDPNGKNDLQPSQSEKKVGTDIASKNGGSSGAGTTDDGVGDTQTTAKPWPFELPVAPKSANVNGNFIPFSLESALVQSDLARLRSSRPGAIPFIRYITLSHLDYLKFQSNEAFVNFKTDLINSLSVLINHLSTEFLIVRPEPIEDSMSTFRIDIRDYGWSRAEWERLVSDNQNDPDKEAYPYNNDFDIVVRQVADEINTSAPIVRGDWLMTEATKPNSYHDLVEVPNNLAQLEQELGVNRNDNIVRTIEDAVRPKSIRVGISALKSGVSVNNRVLDRHVGTTGYYWISYDFAAANGDAAKNIFGAPIGPGVDILNALDDRDFADQTAFEPDGGEVIWLLPNGLQGYMLVDAVGGRINEAPTNVVFDPTAREDGGEIVNGSSCLSCHGGGLLAAKDSMRAFIEDSDPNLFPQVVVDAVRWLHPEQGELDAIFASDNNLYRPKSQAAFLIGDRKDRISQILDYYELPMSFDMLASELNLTPAQLDKEEEVLPNRLTQLVEASKARNLNRDDFERAFDDFIQELFRLD